MCWPVLVARGYLVSEWILNKPGHEGQFNAGNESERKFGEMKGVYHLNGYSLKNSDPERNVFSHSHLGYLKVRNKNVA